MQWNCSIGQTKVYIDKGDDPETMTQIAELPIDLRHIAQDICDAHNTDVKASTATIMDEIVDSWRKAQGLPAISR